MSGINLSGIVYIYRARLEARSVLVQEAFAILGIAVGVALLFASQVASTSLDHAITQLNNQFVGSAQVQIEARGPEGVNERLLNETRKVRGIQVALPIFERQLNLIGPHAERSVDLIGIDPHAVQASGPILRRFSAKQIAAQEVVALPAPLAAEIGVRPLEPVKLQIGDSFSETLVGATLNESDIGGLVDSPIAVAPLHYAQQLTHAPQQINRIFIRYDPRQASPARAALRRLATRWHVNLVPGHFDNKLFAVAVAPESSSENLFSAISALVGFMFALNAMLMTVPSRRTLIEDVRLHGASRWDTTKILLFDTFVVGTLACLIGLGLGEVLSLSVFHSTPAYLGVAFPVGSSRLVTWQSIAVAILAGMMAAAIGVFWPLREIIARPLLPPADTKPRSLTAARIFIALPCVGLSLFTLLYAPKAAVFGNVSLIVALVLLLPLLFDGIIVAFGRLALRLDGVAASLAVTGLQTPQTRIRSLAIATTAAVAVFGVVEFQGTQTNLARGIARASHGTDAAGAVWIMPRGKTSVQPTMAFNAIETKRLTTLPGVRQIGVFRGSFLNWGDRRLWVLAPPTDAASPVPAGQVISANPQLASARVRTGAWAALSESLAAEQHLHVGEQFTLPAPHPLHLRVAALTTNLGWPPGALIISSSTYARAWSSQQPTAYTITTQPGVSAAIMRERVRRALRAVPGLAVETSAERDRRHDVVAAEGLSRLTQIRILVLIAATLAIITAMGAMIWQRRDLIAFIKCQGYEEGLLWRWLVCEAAVLLVAGCSIGAAFGLYAQLLGSHFLAVVTGFPIVYSVEGLAAVSSFVLVSAVALAVVALPGYVVVRVPPTTVSPAY